MPWPDKGPLVRAAAVEMVQAITNNSQVTVISQSKRTFSRSLAFSKPDPDKGYSLTDCGSMLLMRETPSVRGPDDRSTFRAGRVYRAAPYSIESAPITVPTQLRALVWFGFIGFKVLLFKKWAVPITRPSPNKRAFAGIRSGERRRATKPPSCSRNARPRKALVGRAQ